MADGIRRTERSTPKGTASPLLAQFQLKLVQALAAKVRWASAELERAKVAQTPQRALDLLNPVTAALTVAGHYDHIQEVHEAQVQALQHKLLGASTAAALMQRQGLDLEALAGMDQAQLRRWVSTDAAQAVQDLFTDPDVKLARRGILDPKRYACLDPSRGADTEHLKSVNALLGAKIKEPVDVAQRYYQRLSESPAPAEKWVGVTVDGAWKGAVALRRAGQEAIEIAGRSYASGTHPGARLGQAAVLVAGATLEVVGAPVLAIDPAASDAARGGAVIDSALLVLGAAGNLGKSYGLAGAGGQQRAILGRVAKLSGELQDAFRPLAELDQALRRSNLGQRLDAWGETLNPTLFKRGRSPSAAPGEHPEAVGPAPKPAAKRPEPEVTLPEVEVSSPSLTRPIDEGDLVDIAADLKARAQHDAELQIMRAAPTEIVPRVHKVTGRRGALAQDVGPAPPTEATAVGDLAGSHGALGEPTWPDGPGARPAFSEPTATGPLWERPPQTATQGPAHPSAKGPAPAQEARVREATPTQNEVQDNLQNAPPKSEAAPTGPSEAPTGPSEAPTEVPSFQIGRRKHWILATVGGGPSTNGAA